MIRSTYMQSIMDSTYAGVAIEAIKNGFDGAWERLIAERLKKDCEAEHSEALEIVESLIDSPGPKEKHLFLMAAYLITSSKIEGHEKLT
jgi:hypothetical protein